MINDFRAVKEATTVLVANQPHTPPPLLWSSVGEGKSSFAETLARSLGYDFYQLPASQIDPTLILGLPAVNIEKRITEFYPPEFYASERLLLLLDEVNTAPESVIAATMETIRTRRLGGRVFHSLKIILSANPYEEAAGGYILPIPLRNRVIHINWNLPYDDFAIITSTPPFKRLEHLPYSVGLVVASPEEIEREWVGASALVDAFLQRFPHHFKTMKKPSERENAFPTPRAWDNVKMIIAVFRAVNASSESMYVAIAGAVGEGIAYEFMNFVNQSDMPTVEEMLSAPQLLLGLRQDMVFAALHSLVAYAAQKPQDIGSVFDVALFLEKENRADFAYYLVRKIIQVCETYAYPIPLGKIKELKNVQFLETIKRVKEVMKGEKKGKQ